MGNWYDMALAKSNLLLLGSYGYFFATTLSFFVSEKIYTNILPKTGYKIGLWTFILKPIFNLVFRIFVFLVVVKKWLNQNIRVKD